MFGIAEGQQRILHRRGPVRDECSSELEVNLVHREGKRVGDLPQVLLGAHVGDEPHRHRGVQIQGPVAGRQREYRGGLADDVEINLVRERSRGDHGEERAGLERSQPSMVPPDESLVADHESRFRRQSAGRRDVRRRDSSRCRNSSMVGRTRSARSRSVRGSVADSTPAASYHLIAEASSIRSTRSSPGSGERRRRNRLMARSPHPAS